MKQQYLVAGILLILVFYVSTYIYYDGSIPFRVHDNLDSNIVWLSYYVDSTNWFPNPFKQLDSIIGNVPIGNVNAFEHLPVYIFRIFDNPSNAYFVIRLLVSLVAFLGMFLLWSSLNDGNNILLLITSLSFAMTSFWGTDFSVAGLPLLVYTLIGRNRFKVFILCVLGFCFNPVLTGWIGTLIIMGLVLYSGRGWIRVIVFLLPQILISYPLFISASQASSHRSEMIFKSEFGKVGDLLFNNHIHLLDNHSLVFCATIFLMFITRAFSNRIKALLTILVVLVTLSYCFDYLNTSMRIPVNLTRIWWVSTPLFYSLFFVVVTEMKSRIASIAIVVSILIYNTASHEFFSNSSESWKNYHRQDELCGWLKSNFDTRDKRILTFGIEPMTPVLCGYKIAGGYLPMYPLVYKHAFLKLIDSEIIKNEELRDYYHNWGSRLYLVSSKDWSPGRQGELYPEVNWNIAELKEQDIVILSRFRIEVLSEYLIKSNNYFLYEFN